MHDLWLMIEDWRCRCGNTWTHSRVRHIHGGTPPPVMEEKNWCSGYDAQTYHTAHCYRCVPLQLGIGWTELQLTAPSGRDPGPSQPKRKSLDD